MPIRPAAVVFDMDGLLFDSEALYREAFLVAARDLGHSFTAGDFLELVGRPWTTNRATLQARLDGTGDADALKSVWMRHYEAKRVSLALKAGVEEVAGPAGRTRPAACHLHLFEPRGCTSQSCLAPPGRAFQCRRRRRRLRPRQAGAGCVPARGRGTGRGCGRRPGARGLPQRGTGGRSRRDVHGHGPGSAPGDRRGAGSLPLCRGEPPRGLRPSGLTAEQTANVRIGSRATVPLSF